MDWAPAARTSMKQPNIATLFESCKSTLVSYLTSSLPIGNHPDQQHLGERFFSLWQKELFRGPYLEFMAPYVRSESLAQLCTLGGESELEPFLKLLKPKLSWHDLEN